MMGVFTEWQGKYAAVGIVTVPVDPETKIARLPWNKIGLPGSTKLTRRKAYQDCDGIGFVCGQRSGITDVDIDEPNEALLREALDRFGETPIVVQTASGKYHCWYRHNGERRSVRKMARQLWGEPVPIDILGGGLSVAPPTTGPKGTYKFIRGGLEDIQRLPPMRGLVTLQEEPGETILPDDVEQPQPNTSGRVQKGNRNPTLFGACMRYAQRAKSFNELLAFAKNYYEEHIEMSADFSEIEVVDTARKAWRYEERGENYHGGRGAVTCPVDVVDGLMANPDALVLLMVARRHHWENERFCLANEMADKTLGWRLPRFRAARKALEEQGRIVVLRRGGGGPRDPTIYRWPKGQKR